MEPIPEKMFYKIGEVCQYTDTQPYVLRFWESEFPQLAPNKTRSGQRIYTREDIDLVLRIKKLLYEEEYTIAGARKRLEQEGSGAAAAEGARPKATPTRARAAAKKATPETKPTEPEPPAPGRAQASGSKPIPSDEEGERLRGRLTVLEARLAEADAAREAARREADNWKARASKAADRLEALLKQIEPE